jgi:Flp pilus assembly pilin Flp
MRRVSVVLIARVKGLAAECGQDLLEYAMIAALVSIFCAGAVSALGAQVNNVLWQTIANSF